MSKTPFAFALGLAVGLAVHSGTAQDRRLPGNYGVNHLAFATPKYAEMMQFYTETLGFAEAFANRNAEGQPTLTYLQASRNTFIELMPAGSNRPAGFTHFGLHVDDVQAVAARLRERGLQVGAPRTIGSGSLTVSVTDPDGNRLELSELPPGAPARKAMDAWSDPAAARSAQDGAAETQIRGIVAEQAAAWNAGDGPGYSRHVAPEVSFTNLFGMVMYGAPAFTQRHSEILATFYKGTTKHHSIRRIRFVTPDVAIVDIDNEVRGVKAMPAGIAVPADGVIKTQLMEVFVRRDGRWLVEAYHNVDTKPSSPPAR